MKIFLKCNPPKSTSQGSLKILRGRGGKMFVGKASNSKGSIARDELMSLLRPHAPSEQFNNPVKVVVKWAYAWRKTEKKKYLAAGFRYCDTRPDCDNLMKLLFDCMTRLAFWKDDSLVCDVRFIKIWGDNPGITISIEEING